jgi:hypothetical protein
MGTYRFVAKLIASFVIPKIKQRKFWRGLASFDPIPYWKEVVDRQIIWIKSSDYMAAQSSDYLNFSHIIWNHSQIA